MKPLDLVDIALQIAKDELPVYGREIAAIVTTELIRASSCNSSLACVALHRSSQTARPDIITAKHDTPLADPEL